MTSVRLTKKAAVITFTVKSPNRQELDDLEPEIHELFVDHFLLDFSHPNITTAEWRIQYDDAKKIKEDLKKIKELIKTAR